MAKRIAVFASGNGSNFQVIAEQFPVEFVFSDHRDAYVLERAKNLGVASHAFELKEFDNKEAYEEAVQVSQTLFSGQIQNLTLEQVDVAFEGVPTVETEENEMNILDALILVGAAKSKREAREFVNGGSVLINGERIKDLEFTVKKEDAFGQSKTVIRRGKKNYFVLKYNG